MFEVNQIVKGTTAGTFVVLGLRRLAGEQGAQLKPVNPNDHSQHGPGELFLPFSCLQPLN